MTRMFILFASSAALTSGSENVVAIFTFVAVIGQRSGIDDGLALVLDRSGLVDEGLVSGLVFIKNVVAIYRLKKEMVVVLDRFGLVDCPMPFFVAEFGLVVGRQW